MKLVFNLEDKVSILLGEKSVNSNVIKSLEEELEFNEELRNEYFVQKTIKSLLKKRLKISFSTDERRKELLKKIYLEKLSNK
ncbi:MAG: hypothetical protein K8F60_05150 [Melioribacteraceae bacterium]|jgi:hypothetical protein|nr:hypothetical protein [Melioribacteraceae bacterium]